MKELNWWGCYSDSLKGKIVDEAFSHPAKMAWGLTMRIFQHLFDEGWLKEGDLVADPFGGIGVTALAAASFGCPCIIVELEEKFVDLAEQNFELHREQWEKMGKPHPMILQGDSRQFSSIIREAVDSIITSPPHSTQEMCGTRRGLEHYDNTGKHASCVYGMSEGQVGAMKEGKLDEVVAVITSPPYAGTALQLKDPEKKQQIINRMRLERGQIKGGMGRSGALGRSLNPDGYGQSEGQLGGMPEGNLTEVVDSIITSPPYAESLRPETEEQTRRKQERIAKAKAIHDGRALEKPSPGKAALGGGYGVSKGQIGHLHEGNHGAVISGIVTSPPYSEQSIADVRHKHFDQARAEQCIQEGWRDVKRGYSADPANMGNLPEGSHEAVVDAVVTSPPYENTVDAHGEGPSSIGERHGSEAQRGEHAAKGVGRGYGITPANIGNEQGTTYWEAMKDVYCECLKSLKPGGVMAVVVKAFVRNKKIVDLPSQTLELLEAIGLEPLERIRAWMVSPVTQASMMPDVVPPYRKEKKSFFRRLAERKGSPKIDFEEVLVVRKPISDCH